ncbi:hypothetical protein GOP47_0022631 [Adiantum capillus-veneris]|uniref:RNA-dependent RNA polymerase n=1 Tax=Adiantum capillus-veneris TaxID=13818 RepID=A0A9D4Z675_ADICA|nr:hypothetical protein GOP47_0022631 [Adiantum capillus-veneris]
MDFRSLLQQLEVTESSTQNVLKYCVDHLPPMDSADELVEFLESKIRRGAVAQCRLRTERDGSSSRMAFVQFRTNQDASSAIELSRRGRLALKGSRLKVFPDKKLRKRDEGTTTVNDVVLHAGCLIKKDVLHKLWTCQNCKIEVDNARKRFCIIVPYRSEKIYKLEWPFRDIHEFCHCSSRYYHAGQTFMLRVWHAPQIYQLSSGGNHYVCENFYGSIWNDAYEPVWTRTIDFSPEASIGQSFVYCLEVPQQYTGKLDHLIRTILGFPMEERNLAIREGSCYSARLQTVPILASPYLEGIPFEIVFLVNYLVQLGYLSGPSLGRRFFNLLLPSQNMTLDCILYVLNRLAREEDTCFDPENWFQSEVRKFLREPLKEKLTNHSLDDGLMQVRKVFVTPSRVYFSGPEVDVSNRVTRQFKDHIDDFLRVSFVEEDADQIPASALVLPRRTGSQTDHTEVYNRIVSVLENGIAIGDKVFEFLAFSTSQLRENSAWMFSANARATADSIRSWMGDFLEIRNVAKCAARMGQSFSSSTKSLDVLQNERENIPDVWDVAKTYCFSDGIGKISTNFATRVAKKCKLRDVPSMYQIRYGGYKGVVAVDPRSRYKLSLRPSMCMFSSSQISLDILNWSRVLPSYLNREIITLLSTLGVGDSIFERMQTKVMQNLDMMLSNTEVALDVIQSFNGDSETNQIMIEMLTGGFLPDTEPFLIRMLRAFRAYQLMNLRKKTRIFVSKGRLLMGCLDETRTLNYGQVYISVSQSSRGHVSIDDGLNPETINGINNVPQTACIIKGRVIVAKNPCVHPGDVRVLTAVDVPALRHLVDCVVFPQKGRRPHPSECSGSDLDGDMYFVSWDENLIPPTVHPPQDYQPPQEIKLDRPVITQDIIRYFADFMVNNSLGLISNAHVVFADMSPEKACDPKCLQLAKLCSIAVDFPKTGVAAVLPTDLRPQKYPDFMEKSDKPSYKSEKVLGKLFRAVVKADKDEEISSFTREEAVRSYDEELEFEGFGVYLEEAKALKNCYDEKLLDLMYQYDVKSEAEMFTGQILKISKWFRKRPGEVKERMMRAMSSLRKEARSWLRNEYDDDNDDGDDYDEVSSEQLKRASAWYHVTYHPDYITDDVDTKCGHLLSFPWVVYDKLVFIKKWRLSSA